MFAQGARKVPPLPLCPSFSSTHSSTGCPNRKCSLVSTPFTHLSLLLAFACTTAPPFVFSPHSNKGTTRERTAGTQHPVCIGGAEGMHPLLLPSSYQHSPLPSLPRLLSFVHAPSRFRPLFSTCTGGYSPFPACLKRGSAAKPFRTCTPFLLRYSALHAPPTHLVCPHTPQPCMRVWHSPRAQSGG